MDLRGLSSRSVVGMFFEELEKATGLSWVKKVSVLFPSNQEMETYKWLGFSPALRRWIGGRNPKGLRENGIDIKNLKYESTLEVDVDDLRRDKTGQIKIRIGEQVDRAIAHWASLLSTLIINAESTVCYDGQFYFDDDHSEGKSGSQSNDLSASDYSDLAVTTPTNPTANELAKVILKMIQHMYTLKDDQGEPMNEFARKFLVMVPVPFWGAALQAITSQRLDTGSGTVDNPLYNQAAKSGEDKFELDLAPNPRLSWTNKLAIFRTDGRAKPFIRQAESLDGSLPASINDESYGIKVAVIGEGSEEEFKFGRHLYGIETNRNVGYGYWQQGTLATLSAK